MSFFTKLMNKGSAPRPDKRAEMLGAIERGDFNVVKTLLESEPELANAVFAENSTPLHVAMLCNHKEIVRLLISNGADVNAKDDNGYTPLFAATLDHEAGDRRETVKFLIAHGADVNATDTLGQTALHNAARVGKKEVVEVLLANKADPSLETTSGITAEQLADATEHHEIVALLKEAATSANEIHEPVTNGDINRVEAVLKNKPALANALDASGKTPLHIAVMFDRNEIIELLITLGAHVDSKDRDGRTPFQQAMMVNSYEIAEILMKRGANVDAKNPKTGSTLLHSAAGSKNIEDVKFLLAHGADVNAKHDEGGTPLHQAAAWSSVEIVELLLENNADPTMKTNSGKTAEEVADEYDNPEIAELLRQVTQG
jgi:ankyrin repeat protein